MFYLKKPSDFISQRDVVICYLVHNDEILLLRRNDDKFRGGTWTAPGGKREPGETIDQTIIRELFEETNIKLEKENISYVNNCFIKHDHFHFTLHLFKAHINEKPTVILNKDENDQYNWTKIQNVHKLELIEHGIDCLNLTFN